MVHTDISDLIDRIWKIYNINGRIGADDLPKAYNELYQLLHIQNTDNLNVINEFISLSSRGTNMSLKKTDLEYLHDKLIGKSIEELVPIISDDADKENVKYELNNDEDDDACQVLYSPHKKTPKVVPIFEDDPPNNNDIARNLFDTKIEAKEDHDLTRDIFNDKLKVIKNKKKPSKEVVGLDNELEEKKLRIQNLEKVLLELQSYIQKLNGYNDKELIKLKEKYESKINNCELKIEEINKSIKNLQKPMTLSNNFNLRKQLKLSFAFSVNLLKRYGVYLVLLILLVLFYGYSSELYKLIFNFWIKVQTVASNLIIPIFESHKDDDLELDRLLQEFAHLIDLAE